MTNALLKLTRHQILAFRRNVGALDERLPMAPASLRRAAWVGLQDSVPRAALLSIHARVAGTEPSTWGHPALVQVWTLRFSVFVVAERDRAPFTLGLLPDAAKGLRKAYDLATRLKDLLGEQRMAYGAAGDALGLSNANMLRYAAATGTVLMRWDGTGQPTIWSVAPPDVDSAEARLELARRYLHIYGPTTAESFGRWSGLGERCAAPAFAAIARSLTPVLTPIGEASILTEDEGLLRREPGPPAPARLLPSGDPFWLAWDTDRDLLVPDAARRAELWTPRVWPGALLVGGEIAGTWRRADTAVTVQPWRRLSAGERDAVADEAESLPLPGLRRRISIRWNECADASDQALR
jgi:hypothetical protein